MSFWRKTGGIRDWIRYHTEFWNEDHDKVVMEIAVKLVWFRPGIRNRILREVEEALKHVRKEDEEDET